MLSRPNLLALLGVGVSAFVLTSVGALAADTHEQQLAKAAAASTASNDAGANVAIERARREAAEKMVAQLQSESSQSDAALADLQKQLSAANANKGKSGASAGDVKKYEDQISQLNAQIGQMQSARAASDAKMAQLQQQLAAASAGNASSMEAQQQVDIERARREAAERAMAELQSSNQGQMAQMQKQLAAAKAQPAPTPANDPQAAVEKARRQATEAELQRAKSAAGAADSENIRLSKENNQMQQQAAAMQQQMVQLKAQASNDKTAQTASQLAELEQRNSELMAQLQATKAQNEAAAKATVMNANNDAATNAKIAEIGKKAATDHAEFQALLEAEKSRREKLEAMLSQNGAATSADNTARLNEMSSQVSDLTQKNAALEQRLAAEKGNAASSGASAGQVAQLQKQLSTMQSDNAMLAQKLASQSASAATASNVANSTQMAELQKQLAAMKNDNAMLAQKMASQSASSAPADTAQVAELQKQLNSMKSDNEMLADKLAVASKNPPVAAPASGATSVALASGDPETQSAVASLKAERDEYRNLLQRERLQEKERQAKGETATGGAGNERIAQLENERADLVKKLEFEKSKNEENGIPSGGEPTGATKDMQDRLDSLQKQLKVAQQDVIDARAKASQAAMAAPAAPAVAAAASVPDADVQALVSENKRLQGELANGKPANADVSAMQSEITSLRAQNSVLNGEMNKRLAAAPDRAAMDNAAAQANFKMAQAQTQAQAEAAANIQKVQQAAVADVQKAQTRFDTAESENIRLAKELAASRSQGAQALQAAQTAQAAAQAAQVAAQQAAQTRVAVAAPAPVPVVQQQAPAYVAAVPAVSSVLASQISRPENARDTVPASRAIVSQPVAPLVVTATAQQVPAMPVTATQVSYVPQPATANIGPSGGDISGYLQRAGIPMVSGFEKVSKVSGPQFGAFRWDTGTVFGTAEQEIMPNDSGFEQAVSAYLIKTKQRCTGNFDQSFDAGQFAQHKDFAVADVACIMPDGTGAGAAMVFYYKDGMFNAVAHEGDITQFDQAMSTRDTFARFMQGVL